MNAHRNATTSVRAHSVNVHCAVAAVCLCALAAAMVVPMASGAKTAGELQSEIASKRAKEGALQGDIQSMSSKIQGLRGRIATLQSKQNRIQANLDVKQAREQKINAQLTRSRNRLNWLRAKLARSRTVLAKRLVAIYKAGRPSYVTVILKSEGFAQMVERATYLKEVA